MVWESGCVVIVMLTPLAENGTKQCHQYWPDEGSDLYHIYEFAPFSHIWCEDFLVRSFYLKNVQTNETRTVTQFHFLSWMDQSVPESARTLLDFRRCVPSSPVYSTDQKLGHTFSYLMRFLYFHDSLHCRFSLKHQNYE
uniref:Tyrosine-protein phosphatase domain-containing protein n=1 Tax=Astyanax mexicanus TaxID=7994 RepID=A0A3B1K7C5_ASTMX